MALAEKQFKDIEVQEYPVEINPRTGKPYIMPLSMRNNLRVKALKREQDKRIKKTADESKKRKARKTKSSV